MHRLSTHLLSALPAILDELFHRLKQQGILENQFTISVEFLNVLTLPGNIRISVNFFRKEGHHYIMSTLFLDNEESNCNKNHNRVALEGSNCPFRFKNIIDKSCYYPMLRHHFGFSSLEESIRGIEEIAESEQVDIISIAPDQTH